MYQRQTVMDTHKSYLPKNHNYIRQPSMIQENVTLVKCLICYYVWSSKKRLNNHKFMTVKSLMLYMPSLPPKLLHSRSMQITLHAQPTTNYGYGLGHIYSRQYKSQPMSKWTKVYVGRLEVKQNSQAIGQIAHRTPQTNTNYLPSFVMKLPTSVFHKTRFTSHQVHLYYIHRFKFLLSYIHAQYQSITIITCNTHTCISKLE